METDVRILEIQPYFTREQSRTPLKFGGVVMDSAWLCHVRVLVENRRGQRGEGWGAIFLSDVWGWPSSRVDHPQREELMVQLVTAWCRRLGEVRTFAHPIDLFWELEPELESLTHNLCRDAGAAEEMPRLNALICASAADAAIHDAFGNAAGIDTYLGYGPDHMDHDLSRWLGSSYTGRYVADFLHPLPEQVDAFHLVGGMDKLSEAEVAEDDPDDGLPVSLDQWIRYEALRVSRSNCWAPTWSGISTGCWKSTGWLVPSNDTWASMNCGSRRTRTRCATRPSTWWSCWSG